MKRVTEDDLEKSVPELQAVVKQVVSMFSEIDYHSTESEVDGDDDAD